MEEAVWQYKVACFEGKSGPVTHRNQATSRLKVNTV